MVHSPLVEKVELVRVGKARRARLFYLRDRIGKAAKTKEQVGARIEDKEIVVKEDLTEEPVVEPVEGEDVTHNDPKEEIIEEPVVDNSEEPVEETPVVEDIPEGDEVNNSEG